MSVPCFDDDYDDVDYDDDSTRSGICDFDDIIDMGDDDMKAIEGILKSMHLSYLLSSILTHFLRSIRCIPQKNNIGRAWYIIVIQSSSRLLHQNQSFGTANPLSIIDQKEE